MRDLFPATGRTPTDDGHSGRPTIPQPFPIDAWVASSLLQKAIRRGDADLAERAAITLHRLRGNRIWRRFLVIAFEDVGIASVEALIKTTAACTAPSWRANVAGGDERVLCLIARLLAEAPKDRSPDHLISVAQSHPALEDARRRVGAMTIAQRVDRGDADVFEAADEEAPKYPVAAKPVERDRRTLGQIGVASTDRLLEQ